MTETHDVTSPGVSSWVVPSRVTSINVYVWGGANGFRTGALSGINKTGLIVTPNEELVLTVGGGVDQVSPTGSGGFNGGGDGGVVSGMTGGTPIVVSTAGSGASSIIRGSGRILVSPGEGGYSVYIRDNAPSFDNMVRDSADVGFPAVGSMPGSTTPPRVYDPNDYLSIDPSNTISLTEAGNHGGEFAGGSGMTYPISGMGDVVGSGHYYDGTAYLGGGGGGYGAGNSGVIFVEDRYNELSPMYAPGDPETFQPQIRPGYTGAAFSVASGATLIADWATGYFYDGRILIEWELPPPLLTIPGWGINTIRF